MNSYRKLLVWQKAMELVVAVYEVVNKLPNHEKYALADQMRRAAVSIPSNIAEGQKRASNKEIIQFSGIALGSAAEIETQLLLTTKLYDIDTSVQLALAEEVSRMLSGLIRSLRAK